MSTDDLSAPLGQYKPQARRFRIGLPQAMAGALVLSLAVFAGWAILVDRPIGGEPLVVLRTPPVAGSPSLTSDNPDLRVTNITPDVRPNGPDITIKAAPVVAPPSRTVTIIDGTSGKRQEIQIPADDRPDQLENRSGSDARLTETARRGRDPVPRTRDR